MHLLVRGINSWARKPPHQEPASFFAHAFRTLCGRARPARSTAGVATSWRAPSERLTQHEHPVESTLAVAGGLAFDPEIDPPRLAHPSAPESSAIAACDPLLGPKSGPGIEASKIAAGLASFLSFGPRVLVFGEPALRHISSAGIALPQTKRPLVTHIVVLLSDLRCRWVARSRRN